MGDESENRLWDGSSLEVIDDQHRGTGHPRGHFSLDETWDHASWVHALNEPDVVAALDWCQLPVGDYNVADDV